MTGEGPESVLRVFSLVGKGTHEILDSPNLLKDQLYQGRCLLRRDIFTAQLLLVVSVYWCSGKYLTRLL